MMEGRYQLSLVALSLLIAVLASLTALTMAARANLTDSETAARTWRIGGGCLLGLGIWSMHFVGMLAFHLPIVVSYDLTLTLLSMLVAGLMSVCAMSLVAGPVRSRLRMGAGALLMAAGIACMHYIGMAAMKMHPAIQWHAGWVAASLFLAVAACRAALQFTFHAPNALSSFRARASGANWIGLGITAMHYTGMQAARFAQESVCGVTGSTGMSQTSLALLVSGVVVFILGLALFVAWMEQRLEARLLRLRNNLLAHELDGALAELRSAALHDPLTQLPNRRLLQQRVKDAVCNASLSRHRFALMFIDLDGFKQVNDILGHQAGDDMLIEVSQRMKSLMGPGDTLARLGGDEFVAVLHIGDDAGLLALTGKILHAVYACGQPQQAVPRVTASIGIAWCPDHAACERRLMACADAAMYRAKDGGRNRHVIYTPV